MFSSVLVRAISLMIFAPAVYLTFHLISEFTEGQSTVIAGLAMISLLVSAIALLVARYSFRRGDPITGYSSLVMYILAAVVMIFLELGFWNSSILTSHTSLQRADAAREGVEILAERERQAIRSGSLADSSAEILAKMEAELSQPIGNQPLAMLTSNCSDKQSKVYRLCGDYLELKAAHAKAEAREKAESRIWNAGTRVEQSGLKKDIFSGATAAANLLGGKPEVWAGVFSVVMMLLLMATRDLSALGAFGPGVSRAGQPQEAAQAPEVPAVAEIAPAAPAPVQAAPEPVREAPAGKGARMGAALDDIRERLGDSDKPTTPPGNGGNRQPEPDADDTVVPLRKPVAELPSFASDMFEESEPPAKRTRTGKQRQGSAVFWLSECTERTNDLSVTCSEDQAWSHYLAWCEQEDFKHISRSKFLRVISVRIGMAPNGRGFIGLVLLGIAADEEKMRAFA